MKRLLLVIFLIIVPGLANAGVYWIYEIAKHPLDGLPHIGATKNLSMRAAQHGVSLAGMTVLDKLHNKIDATVREQVLHLQRLGKADGRLYSWSKEARQAVTRALAEAAADTAPETVPEDVLAAVTWLGLPELLILVENPYVVTAVVAGVILTVVIIEYLDPISASTQAVVESSAVKTLNGQVDKAVDATVDTVTDYAYAILRWFRPRKRLEVVWCGYQPTCS